MCGRTFFNHTSLTKEETLLALADLLDSHGVKYRLENDMIVSEVIKTKSYGLDIEKAIANAWLAQDTIRFKVEETAEGNTRITTRTLQIGSCVSVLTGILFIVAVGCLTLSIAAALSLTAALCVIGWYVFQYLSVTLIRRKIDEILQRRVSERGAAESQHGFRNDTGPA